MPNLLFSALRRCCTTIDRLEQLRARLIPPPPGLKIIAFDVFSTALSAEMEPQSQLRSVPLDRLAQLLEKHCPHCPKADELDSLIIKTVAQGHGCSFQELIQKLARQLPGGGGENLETALMELALQIEKLTRHLREGMPELLRELRSQGMRLVAISELGLDEEQLAELLEDQGIADCFDAFFLLSAPEQVEDLEQVLGQIISREAVLPGQLLYIRGNRRPGRHAFRSLRVRRLLLRDRSNLRQRRILKSYERLSFLNPYWRGRHLLQLIRPPASRGNFFYDYGFSVLGPVFSTFMLGAIEAIKEKEIGRVYFLAREGELFLRIFSLLERHLFPRRDAPEAVYLYVSRKSVAPPSIWRGLSFESAATPLNNPKQQGLSSIFKVFGLPAGIFAGIAGKHGFDDLSQPIIQWETHTGFRRLIADPEFQELVIEHAGHHKVLFEKYLEQQGFFTEKSVAFVDIGWNGTIQNFIQDALEDREDCPLIHGLYLGYVAGRPFQFDSARSTVRGIFYDIRRQDPREESFRNFEELFEEGARALHPTTIGYQRDPATGRVEPQLREEHSADQARELEHNGHIAEFHRGVLDFSREFIRALALTGYGFDDIKPFLSTLVERAVDYPNSEETHQLMQLNHSEDFGLDNTIELNGGISHGPKELLHPKAFTRKILNSKWRAGTLRSTGIPGGNHLLRFSDIMRRYR